MNKEAMNQLIQETLYKRLGDGFRISIHEVLKTNIKRDGLIISRVGRRISPTIYLEPFYRDLESGIPLDDVVNEILRTYYKADIHPWHFDITAVNDFNYIKNKLYVQLINRYSNKELLRNVPHSLFLDDFAITVRCIVDIAAEGTASFLIQTNHLKMWQIDQKALISYAIQNTRRIFGLDLRCIKDVIKELRPDVANDSNIDIPVWVMTNNRKLTGAATVLFDDVLKDFAKEHGNFYVIFSSVHEVLLLPAPDNSDINVFTRMNQEVNKTEVQAGEVLGTKAYYYNKDKGFIL